jgi:hypothetical protein
MKTYTHTQGPWKAYFYAKDSYGRIVATVGANDGCNRICEITPIALPESEVEANVRLIAAAPDLLAALKAISDYVAVMHGHRGGDISEYATAAIRKAEGNE